ncbi:competence/damage-inducible protein A [Romboutsia sp. 1001713B170207_170306_H8]|uniref:competence/damage-inducible protein A n=1 Tax=Romboutsia sp. 1001713B170207_170306_H8 TaxID=2787112 RepID=UPI000822FC1B|nr:competence/damage-inducible protein A [Romboutsia sp. 1001713B170207_170306_H8]SCG98737.1 competence damage-inducible protein A [uncultured Clostridium sp.]
MKAEILTVGTEILLGDIVNTNSQYLACELANLGIDVYYQGTVGDNEDRLLDCLKESLDRSDIVITTGGLGPTKDDLTKETAAKFFNQELVLHEPSWNKIEKYFNKLCKTPSENNKKQAYFPKEAIILENNNGTAPGAILKKDNKTIIVLPGPPKEMKPMFDESVKPYLKDLTDEVLVSKTLRFYGIGESLLEHEIMDIIKAQSNPTVAPYAKETEATLRITAKAKNEDEAISLMNPVINKIYDRVGKYIYAQGEVTLEDTVAKLLVDKNLTISVAESCTGGMVSSNLINYPGISSVFMEGCVTYSNEAKIMSLGVNKETLDKFGAVSYETAREMAIGVAKRHNTNMGISTTGIAGPQGGSEEKPVGLVYFGIYINGKTIVKRYLFNGNREQVRLRATKTILNDLRLEIINL